MLTLLRSAGWACVAGLLIALVESTYHFDGVPIVVPLALSALALLAVWRPAAALLVVAALTPIAAQVGRQWNTSVAWPETLAVAFATGWVARRVRTDRVHAVPERLWLPAGLLAAVAAASVAIDLSVLRLQFAADELQRLIVRGYFTSGSDFSTLRAGALLLEGLLLYAAAAAAAARSRRFLTHAAVMLVVGGLAAAAFNIAWVGEAALQSGNVWRTFVRYAATERLNVHHADVNAAGSHFAMLLLIAVTAACARTSRVRLWTLTAAVLAVALWLTGSRAATLSAAIAAVTLLAFRGRSALARGGWVRWSMTAVVIAALGLTVAYLPMRGTQQSVWDAFRVRTGLAQTSLRMLATGPVFGIGVGQYQQRSGEFSSPALLALFPPARNENAHNNFLQILAELGLAGLAAFLWLLTASFASIRVRLASAPDDAVAWGAAGGLAAFLVTSLAGHPLLIREAAYAFWILLGSAAGAGAALVAGGASSGRPLKWGMAIAVAAIVALTPVRARDAMAGANLEHVGLGVSLWQHSEDGVRYRYAGRASTVFLPASAGSVTVPLRAVKPGARLHVELSLDGRRADAVRATSERWRRVLVVIPPDRRGARFRRLDLQVISGAAPDETQILMVGKVQPH